ncbi:MAG: hypothetical protein J5663_06510, partial [Bacteroidaceae bacterium]|nr:hypothetical protein [Bacteroidaceae bacterium]
MKDIKVYDKTKDKTAVLHDDAALPIVGENNSLKSSEIKVKEMKEYFSILLLFVFSSCGVRDSISNNSLTADDFNTIESFYSMENPNRTKNVYIVDSVIFDPDFFHVIWSDDPKQSFVIPKYLYNKRGNLKDKTLLQDPNTMIFCWTFSVGHNSDYLGYMATDENRSGHSLIKNNQFPIRNGFGVYDFNSKPLFLRVYMVRGDVYNYLRSNQTNSDDSPYRISFPSLRSFYKVAVPIWEDKTDAIRPITRRKRELNWDEYERWSPKYDNVRFKDTKRKRKEYKIITNDIKSGKKI